MPNSETLLPRVKSKERILWMDALQVTAAFAIVLMHSTYVWRVNSSSFPWRLLLGIIGLWAIPVFFMLSGAKLMDYRERYSTKAYFAKRFKKTIIPWVLWSLFAFMLLILRDPAWLSSSPIDLTRYFIEGVWNTWLQPAYWFFIPLSWVYLCIPLVSLLRERRRLLWCIAAALLIFSTVRSIAEQPVPGEFRDYRFPMSGYLGYAILGYLLKLAKFTGGGKSYYLLSGPLQRHIPLRVYPFELPARRCVEYGFAVPSEPPCGADGRRCFRIVPQSTMGALVSRPAVNCSPFPGFCMWAGYIFDSYVFIERCRKFRTQKHGYTVEYPNSDHSIYSGRAPDLGDPKNPCAAGNCALISSVERRWFVAG